MAGAYPAKLVSASTHWVGGKQHAEYVVLVESDVVLSDHVGRTVYVHFDDPVPESSDETVVASPTPLIPPAPEMPSAPAITAPKPEEQPPAEGHATPDAPNNVAPGKPEP